MAKLRLKKKVKRVLILSVVLIVGLIFGINKYKDYKYKQTDEYKLLSVGYTIDDVNVLLDRLKDKDIEYFISNEKSSDVISIINEKYYLSKNLYEYLDYKKENKDTSYSDVISIVNVGAHKEWYDSDYVKPTDMSKDYLILVNKFNYLSNDYEPEDLVNVSLNYSYSGNKAREEVNSAYISMAKKAKEDGITLLVNSSYRNYERQDEIYKEFYLSEGISYADSYAARAGYSEHQTGLCLDIFTSGASTTDNFDQSDAFKWLINNSYKYGFILRYPDKKNHITGYKYEPWHYRYVGIDVATKIFLEDITFEEYIVKYLSSSY